MAFRLEAFSARALNDRTSLRTDRFRIARWAGETVIFDRANGATHALDSRTSVLFDLLKQGVPPDGLTSALGVRLNCAKDASLDAWLAEALDCLTALELLPARDT